MLIWMVKIQGWEQVIWHQHKTIQDNCSIWIADKINMQMKGFVATHEVSPYKVLSLRSQQSW